MIASVGTVKSVLPLLMFGANMKIVLTEFSVFYSLLQSKVGTPSIMPRPTSPRPQFYALRHLQALGVEK